MKARGSSAIHLTWLSVPDYLFKHFFMNFNKNTHICQRSTIAIDFKGKTQGFLHRYIKLHSILCGEINMNENNFWSENSKNLLLKSKYCAYDNIIKSSQRLFAAVGVLINK